jgi:two-component system, sensor histidine kinase and response regulator
MTETEHRPRALVVDDDQQNGALAKATLEQENYEVALASNGVEDRPETCRRLRTLPEGADVPIVFLTASRDIDTFEAALAAGGDDFLTKPVQATEMALRVQPAVRVRGRDSTNEQYVEDARLGTVFCVRLPHAN